MISITIPLPPSENKRLIMARGRFILSKEARDYLNTVPFIIQNKLRENKHTPRSKYMNVYFTFCFKDNRRRDTHNYYKILADCLEKGGLVTDDRYILTQTVTPIIDTTLKEHEVIIEWEK